MYKKNYFYIKSNFLYFIPILLLLLFIVSIWDKNYYIGGDLMFPLNPQENIKRSISLWDEQNRGNVTFMYLLLSWQGFFYLFSLLSIPSYIIIKIFIVILYILGFVFSYLLFKLMFEKTKYGGSKNSLISALFFFLNPAAILVLIGAIPLYGIPICLYFLIKYIKSQKLVNTIFFAFFFNISFFTESIQIKHTIVFFISALFTLLVYLLLHKTVFLSLIKKLLTICIVTLLLNAYILIPFLNDVVGEKGIYSFYTQNVIVYDGNADLYSAAIPFTSRFYNSNLVDKSSKLGQFLGNPIFIIWTFFLWIIGLIYVIKTKEKKLIYLILTILTFFIFFAKGSNDPFGAIYKLLLFNIPFFKIFRTTSTIIIGAVFFYTVFITIAFQNLFKNKTKLFYLFLFVHIIVFFPVYFGYKLYTPKNSFRDRGYSIPSDYFKLAETVNKTKDDLKILAIPPDNGYVEKSWGYSGQSITSWLIGKPLIRNNIIGLADYRNITSNEACKATSINNIGYLLLEKDTLNSYFPNLDVFPSSLILENNFFLYKKVSPSCLYPVVYIPENIIEMSGNTENFYGITDLFSSNKGKTALVNQNIINQYPSMNDGIYHKIISGANKVAIAQPNVKPLLREITYKRIDFGQSKHEVFYPYVRIAPDSVLYFYVDYKEKHEEKNLQNQPVKLFKNYLLYASKRISEIEKWGIDNSSLEKTLNNYYLNMQKAITIAKKNKNDDLVRDLETVYGQLNNHREKIEEISLKDAWDYQTKRKWLFIFDKIEKYLNSLYKVPNYNDLEYSFDIPQAEEYELLMRDKTKTLFPSDSNNWQINLNDKSLVNKSKFILNNLGFFSLGSVKLNKENNYLKVNLNLQNSIERERWNKFEYKNVELKDNILKFRENSLIYENALGVFQDIKDWGKDTSYYLNMEYEGDPNSQLGFVLTEEKYALNDYGEKVIKTYALAKESTSILRRGKGKFTALINTSKDSLSGKLYIVYLFGNSRVTNINFHRVIIPEIFLTKKPIYPLAFSSPIISFKKLNPTKYKISVSDIKNPYLLIFSQNFHPGWKIYSIKDNKSKNLLDNYSNGVFETIFQSSLPESNHFPINGYANAWLIEPGETEYNKNKEYIIEFNPQKLFNIGILISLFTFIFCLIFIIYEKVKKNYVASRHLAE